MATIDLTPTNLSVTFSTYEKVAGLLRDVSIPADAVASVSVEPDGIRAARGLRAPGLGVPGLRKIGTWRHRADGRTRRTVVSVRRGQPAVRIELHGISWDQLLIGHGDARAVAAELAPRR
jgi:hypothetical protein